MEPLPDLATLSDSELKKLIEQLEQEENEISYRRRLLQGRVDILRAERNARLKRSVEGGTAELADVGTLADILSSKGAPPAKEEA